MENMIRIFLFLSIIAAIVVGSTSHAEAVPVIVAAISAAASAFGFTTFAAFAATAFGNFVISAAVTAGAYLYSRSQQDASSQFSQGGMSGRDVNFQDSVVARPIIYGQSVVGGPIIYAQLTNSNQYMHLIIALAGHEVSEISTIYLNDEAITLDTNGVCTAPTKFANKIRVLKKLGSPSQTAQSNLVSESGGLWTNNHKLSNVAYIYARLTYDTTAFPNGVPTITAKVNGKLVYDPRTETTAYSNNASLVVLDYLMDSTYGFGASASEINMDSFISAANVCDTLVPLVGGSSTEKKYTANGVASSERPRKDIMADLLTACSGSLYYSAGYWNLKVGSYSVPTKTITDDDMRGPINLVTRHSKRDNFNSVKGVFVDPDSKWQPTDYPAITSATFLSEDNDVSSTLDLGLPYTISSSMAQRLAKIALYKQRQQQTISLQCKLTVYSVQIGDTIMLTNSRYGFVNKPFEVINYNFVVSGDQEAPTLGIDLELRETSAAVYDWNAEEKTIINDNTSLPDYSIITPPGITISDELRTINQDVVTALIINLDNTDSFTSEYEVAFKKSSDTTWTSAGRSSNSRFEVLKVDDGVNYDVRAQIISALGARSDYSYYLNYNVIGKTASPSDVTNLQINVAGGFALLTWDATPDLDLSHYIIRHAQESSGAVWTGAATHIYKVSRPGTSITVPAMVGTYFIKAVDKLGNYSQNATYVIVPVGYINEQNIVQTITESPSFSGTKTNTVVSGSTLELDVGQTSGTYEFALTSGASLDLGGIYTSRCFYELNYVRVERGSLFDSAGGLFDSRSGLFDGAGDYDDSNVYMEIATTNDNPSGTPTWSSWKPFLAADYTARAFKFRATLTAESTNITPQLTNLAVVVDMPDRIQSGQDIVSGTATYSVVFASPFKALQALSVLPQDLTSGDYYVISNKTTSGFDVTFRNSSGTIISKTFDYIARGYGR
jgi:hypothetical protein